jgi:hypothetical protein
MQLSLGLFSLVFMWHYAVGAAVGAEAQGMCVLSISSTEADGEPSRSSHASTKLDL